MGRLRAVQGYGSTAGWQDWHGLEDWANRDDAWPVTRRVSSRRG